MQKKTKRSIAAVILIVAVIGIAFAVWPKDFDAKAYVQAVLDLTFQEDVVQASAVIEGTSRVELREQYKNTIAQFVTDHITGGTDISAGRNEDFEKLAADIFRIMRYDVRGAKKIHKDKYEVEVKIHPADVFEKFVEGVKQDSEALLQKAEAGEYAGTEAEINEQMQYEFVLHAYHLLESAYEDISYKEEEAVILSVERGEDKTFEINEEEFREFLIKIVGLGEIED